MQPTDKLNTIYLKNENIPFVNRTLGESVKIKGAIILPNQKKKKKHVLIIFFPLQNSNQIYLSILIFG